jgi:hypothetical protein
VLKVLKEPKVLTQVLKVPQETQELKVHKELQVQ